MQKFGIFFTACLYFLVFNINASNFNSDKFDRYLSDGCEPFFDILEFMGEVKDGNDVFTIEGECVIKKSYSILGKLTKITMVCPDEIVEKKVKIKKKYLEQGECRLLIRKTSPEHYDSFLPCDNYKNLSRYNGKFYDESGWEEYYKRREFLESLNKDRY